ncbi:hypothetical protein [Shewanella algidipiscicola]|uniref:Sulfotransferase family protein n=1 Tax=Shewanella algidipiscicola TaxID=614070 RepID=A0ABQ4NU66_9GAMM|nr:hypothetical protein [Shewanella algidipiscicola]GIU02821.1 hypothetical protein TUM4630_35250 [Shewanella algidipiscicola]
MTSTFELFKNQLDDALALIDQTESFAGQAKSSDLTHISSSVNTVVDTQSLLARCEKVCNKHEPKKPTIRIIHHLACSGGTLISKCISAMPNVYLLSEVHPYTDLAMGKDKPKYAPSDIISLTKYSGIPQQKELAQKLFKSAIDEVYQHVNKLGGTLVLRDHTHADFHTKSPIPVRCTLVELLEEDYDVRSVLTIRNPIDSYASLIKNDWVHFEPQTFDEYCRRFLCLIEQFKPEQIFKYEDFVEGSEVVMANIAAYLRFNYCDSYKDTFAIFSVTGDSGRSGGEISKRVRRPLDEKLIQEIAQSNNFRRVCEMLDYQG